MIYRGPLVFDVFCLCIYNIQSFWTHHPLNRVAPCSFWLPLHGVAMEIFALWGSGQASSGKGDSP